MEQNRNTNKDQKMLTGMFADRETAENAYNALQDRGYSNDEIDLIMSDETRKESFSSDDMGDTEIGTEQQLSHSFIKNFQAMKSLIFLTFLHRMLSDGFIRWPFTRHSVYGGAGNQAWST